MKQLQTFVLAVVIIIVGCKSEKERVEEGVLKTVRAYLDVNLPKNELDFAKIDSLYILSVDTITAKQEIYVPIDRALNLVKYYNRMTDVSLRLAESKQQIANLGRSMYGGYVNELEQENADEAFMEVKDYHDSAKVYMAIVDSLQKIQTTLDSVSLKYYLGNCVLQYSKKDLTFERDTIEVPVTKDFRIVEYEQITKNFLGERMR